MTRGDGTGEAEEGAGPQVLVVDDEPQILRALEVVLRTGGFRVASAGTAAEAVRAAALRPPTAILLDLRLPDGSGVEVCRTIRAWSDAPLIVVSAADDEELKIEALDAGADDYVTKPFSAPELLARVRAAIRRSAVPEGDAPVVRFGDAEVDLERRLVRRAGRPVHMTAHEYELLACLARHPGRVLTHAALLQRVWGPAYGTETHYLRVYIANLRRKLEPEPASPRHILTESGVGYRLRASPERGGRGQPGPRSAGSRLTAVIVPARKSSPVRPSASCAARALARRTPAWAMRWLVASWVRDRRTPRASPARARATRVTVGGAPGPDAAVIARPAARRVASIAPGRRSPPVRPRPHACLQAVGAPDGRLRDALVDRAGRGEPHRRRRRPGAGCGAGGASGARRQRRRRTARAARRPGQRRRPRRRARGRGPRGAGRRDRQPGVQPRVDQVEPPHRRLGYALVDQQLPAGSAPTGGAPAARRPGATRARAGEDRMAGLGGPFSRRRPPGQLGLSWRLNQITTGTRPAAHHRQRHDLAQVAGLLRLGHPHGAKGSRRGGVAGLRE